LDHVHDIRMGWNPHDCLIEYPGEFQRDVREDQSLASARDVLEPHS
jgi:hypothetical protein